MESICNSTLHFDGDPSQENEPSILQILLQPSPSILFPSSHCSELVTIPSCHIDDHSLGLLLEHLYPDSVFQVESHPSLLSVFPSSHNSSESIIPSPHVEVDVAVQTFGELESQVQPDSTTHKLLQPSELFVFPSSHPSAPSLTPFPHC